MDMMPTSIMRLPNNGVRVTFFRGDADADESHTIDFGPTGHCMFGTATSTWDLKTQKFVLGANGRLELPNEPKSGLSARFDALSRQCLIFASQLK